MEDVTNVVTKILRSGTEARTNIDHGFAGGLLAEECTRELVPGVGSHRVQIFGAKVPERIVWLEEVQMEDGGGGEDA